MEIQEQVPGQRSGGLSSLFAPLDRKYCEFFYILAILQFTLLAMGLVSLFFLLMDVKKNKMQIVTQLMSVATLAFMYFYNRLLYGMCVK